jgi:hypothetical protein
MSDTRTLVYVVDDDVSGGTGSSTMSRTPRPNRGQASAMEDIEDVFW